MKTLATPNSRREFMGGFAAAGGLGALMSSGSIRGAEATAPPGVINVRERGAAGDGTRLETACLQQAIDQCAAQGGGTVYFPPGRYLTGALVLRSHVGLHLDSGAVLLGSRDLRDYPSHVPGLRSYTDHYTERSLIYAEDQEHLTLTGRGVIDGQGAAFAGPYKVRPYLIRMVGCRDVQARDLTLKDSPMWVQHYLACDGVHLEGLRVHSRCNHNNDGIDIDGCQQVRIANCEISSGDDAIVLKSTLDRACRNVVITNCVLSSACNAFKLGTESNGGFENITLNNCAIHDTQLAGLALELVDGGTLEQVLISDVTMDRTNGPIFIRLGNRARPFKENLAKPGQGRLQGVTIRNVRATGANQIGCSITGLPHALARDIVLSDIHVRFVGDGPPEAIRRPVPEHPDRYPEYSMFGPLPAYGFYCRHVEGLRLSQVRVGSDKGDPRPGLVCEDVADLRIEGWESTLPPEGGLAIQLTDVRRALLQGCSASRGAKPWLRVNGVNTSSIRLAACYASEGSRLFECSPEVPADSVGSLP